MSKAPPLSGCFIYRVTSFIGLEVRYTKDVYGPKSDVAFQTGDLFAVDLIEPSRVSGLGPFLRLADGRGWLFEKEDDIECCRRVDVEDGTWSFFAVGNFQSISLKSHPVDRDEFNYNPKQFLWPLQKVYCDKRVKSTSGMIFYRLQGTQYWAPYKRNGSAVLYPESLISNELKVFKTRQVLSIRLDPTVDLSSMTGREVPKGFLLAVDYTVVIENDQGNGPFVRLADDSGWLFIYKEGMRVMDELPIVSGRWELQVGNIPEGVTLKSHPNDREEFYLSTNFGYQPYERIVCDKEVEDSTGVRFYRVKGTTGWVPDKRFTKKRGLVSAFDQISEQYLLTPVGFSSDVASDDENNDEEEESLRKLLRDLELDYCIRRHRILTKIYDIDMRRKIEAFNRVQDQKERIRFLKVEKDTLNRKYVEMVTRQIQELEEQQEKIELRRRRGDRFLFDIYHRHEISLSDSDELVAIGGKATLVVNESRILRYTSDLSFELSVMFHPRTANDSYPLATYVSLGSDERYFVRFVDLKEKWCVKNEELERILSSHGVEFIAFGAGPRSYVVRTDTDTYWSNIPAELESIIRDDRPIHSVSLGPNGEYFVAWKDGACTGGNWQRNHISEDIGAAIDRLKREGWHVRDAKFGDDSKFVIRYSDYDGPF